jgi:CRP-like cAMP-binding protein
VISGASVPADAAAHRPTQNRLLASLAAADLASFAARLELVPLRLGDMLYEPGTACRYAYFPTTAVISLHYVTESGASAEAAGVGNEGVLGIALFLGGESNASSAVVQTAGHAYRLDRHILVQEFARGGALQVLLLRYTLALIAQVTLAGACNRHHTIEQQLCRWLLNTLDRIPSGELVMTQELVASVLGVRRESITEVAGKLQRAGLIRYRRGHISVLGRTGLESLVCECYGVVRHEMHRLLPLRAAQVVALPAAA